MTIRNKEERKAALEEYYPCMTGIVKLKKNGRYVTSLRFNCQCCKKKSFLPISNAESSIRRGRSSNLFCSMDCKNKHIINRRKESLKTSKIAVPYISKVFENYTSKQKCLDGRSLLLGISAEHIVCSHLINLGYNAFLTNQAASYDIVLDYKNNLYRVQVKSSMKPRILAKSYQGYLFWTHKRGKLGKKYYNKNDFDVLALVALDALVVAYIPFSSVNKNSIQLAPVDTIKVNKKNRPQINEFPLDICMEKINGNK